jgi:cytochrome c biogenesis protein CcmG, thiol:disulfide interchange protein DsbE
MSNRPNLKPSSSHRVKAARNQSRGGGRIWWIFGGGALVVIFALVVAFARGGVNTNVDSSSSGGTVVPAGSTDYGEVEMTGAALPQLQDGVGDAALGATIPTVTGQQFDGSPITIGPTGTPQVIFGIAHWCPHCQKEVPIIQKWFNDNGMPSDVDFAAVSTSATDTRPNWPADAWLTKQGWTVPTLADDEQGSAAAALGVSGFPYILVVDADGKVVYRTSGEKTVEQWEAIVESARAGTPPVV